MKPLELVLENFGAFHHRTTLDFTALGSLFLVCGPTGAGKTTLFDALMTALYGTTAGSREKLIPQLASHHAPAGSIPSVRLTFALGSQKWRVTRNLAYRKPKIRGDGEVIQESSVLLEKETGGTWTPQDGKKKETDLFIQGLLGLSPAEFSRIVLLPQGEFQRFLESDSREREMMLEKLFPLDQAEALVTELKLRAQTAKAEFNLQDSIWAALKEKIDRLPPLATGEILEENRRKLETLAAEIEATAQRVNEVLAFQASWEEWEKTKKALAEMENRRPAMEELASLVNRARSARPLVPVFQELNRLEKEGQTLAARFKDEQTDLERWSAQEAQLRAQEPLVLQAGETLKTLAGEKVKLDHELQAWNRRRELESLLVQAQRAFLEKDNLQSDLKTELDLWKAQEPDYPPDSAWESAAQEIRRWEEQLLIDQKAREAEKAAALLTQERSDLETRRNSQGLTLTEAETEWNLWREITDQTQAAVLASGLTDGSPCPVCGAIHHPQKAVFPLAQAQAPQRLAAAEEALNRARVEYSALSALVEKSQTLEEAQAAQAKALRQSAGPESGESLEKALAMARKNHEVLTSRRALREPWQKQFTDLGSRWEKVREEAREAQNQVQGHTVALQNLSSAGSDPGPRREALDQEESRLVKLTQEFQNARDRVFPRVTEGKTRLQSLEERLGDQRRQWKTQNALFQEMLQARQWTREQWESLVMDDGVLDLREAELAAWEKGFEAGQTQIQVLEKTLSGQVPQDSGPLKQRLNDLKTARKEVEDQVKAAEFEAKTRLILVSDLEAARETRAQAEARFREVGPLAEAVSGTNSRNLKLKTFLLAQYLDRVAASASLRLLSMSLGRYRLQVQTQGTDGRSAWGLDLAVLDSQTGQERPVGTLSGGEKFMTSIALALGLADVIQERSGGIRLEAIFIDEGFGTLDDQALDRAMNILHDLGQGRQVGIISHVAELRSRIPNKVEVVRGPNGSSLKNRFV